MHLRRSLCTRAQQRVATSPLHTLSDLAPNEKSLDTPVKTFPGSADGGMSITPSRCSKPETNQEVALAAEHWAKWIFGLKMRNIYISLFLCVYWSTSTSCFPFVASDVAVHYGKPGKRRFASSQLHFLFWPIVFPSANFSHFTPHRIHSKDSSFLEN